MIQQQCNKRIFWGSTCKFTKDKLADFLALLYKESIGDVNVKETHTKRGSNTEAKKA